MWYISQDIGRPYPAGSDKSGEIITELFVTKKLETLKHFRGENCPWVSMTDEEFMLSSMPDNKGKLKPLFDPVTGKILNIKIPVEKKKVELARKHIALQKELDKIDSVYGNRPSRMLEIKIAEELNLTNTFEYKKFKEGEALAEPLRGELSNIEVQLKKPLEDTTNEVVLQPASQKTG